MFQQVNQSQTAQASRMTFPRINIIKYLSLKTDLYDAYTGESIMASSGQSWAPGTFIRANREKYRQYLLTGLDVQWKHRFTHYEITQSGGVKAFFEDGTTAIGDILVGADGIRSRGS